MILELIINYWSHIMKMACKNCENCNKPFMFRAYKINRARFCSRKCLGFVVSTKVQKDIREKQNKETFQETMEIMKLTYEKYVIKNEDSCWDWSGTRRGTGYGSFMFRKKQVAAHRASYMIHHMKVIPKGMFVMHNCDNPICTNPQHLILGTPLDNNRDMVLKGRNPMSKLNPETVKEIRILLDEGMMSKDIAQKYNLCLMTIHNIKHGKSWKDII